MSDSHSFVVFVVALAVAVLALSALTASADASACHAEGRAVALADANRAPDYARTVARGARVNLPDALHRTASDFHAYPASGGATRAYRCGARVEYRTASGRVVAVRTGARVVARARAIVAVWEG